MLRMGKLGPTRPDNSLIVEAPITTCVELLHAPAARWSLQSEVSCANDAVNFLLLDGYASPHPSARDAYLVR